MAAGTHLASFAARVDWDRLPGAIRTKVVDHVVDTIGVMFAGIGVAACERARAAAREWGCGEQATVVGLSARHPAPTAAFLNALHGRIHTFDDTYEPGTMHPGSSVIAAALAMAEAHGVDGRTLLCAALAGYEVATRVAAAVSPSHYAAGFHNTGTCTVFGAAAAAGRILALDPAAMAQTLGLAGATAGGLRQHQIDGSMLDTAFHGARAAQSGVMVAQLRASGLGGPPGILDGPLGFCTVMAPKRDLSRLDADLGTRFEFADMTIKPYPTCRFVQGPIEAARALKAKHALNPARMAEVEIATFRQSIEVSDRPEVRTPYDASVSHQYTVAVALVTDKVALGSLSETAVKDRAVLDLMRKVRVIHDSDLERLFPKSWPHRVTIAMDDGSRYSTLSDYPPGRTEPIPRRIIESKFIDLVTPHLGAQRSAAALAALLQVESCANVAELTAALRP